MDFSEPVGYIDPYKAKKQADELEKRDSLTGSTHKLVQHQVEEDVGFRAFVGTGSKLNGKVASKEVVVDENSTIDGVPKALQLPIGKIFLGKLFLNTFL